MPHLPIKFVNIFFSFFTFLHFLVGCTIRMYLRGFPEIQTKEDVTNISFHPTLSSTPGPPVPIHANRNVWSRLQNWFTLSNLKIEKECWPQQENQKKKQPIFFLRFRPLFLPYLNSFSLLYLRFEGLPSIGWHPSANQASHANWNCNFSLFKLLMAHATKIFKF